MSQLTSAQAHELFEAVEGYDATAPIPWPIAAAANALIEKAKSETEDPVIAALQPFTQAGNANFATGQIGSLRVIAKQVFAGVPD
jgi:hypothetical protein